MPARIHMVRLVRRSGNEIWSDRYTGAKCGKKPLLAVATEPGIVHVLDTTKRKDWDVGTALPRRHICIHLTELFSQNHNVS